MYNLIRADLFKIRKSMSIKVLFTITVVCSIVVTIMAHLIQVGKLNGTNGIEFLFSDANVMTILGGTVAGIFICGDFDNRMIHDSIANGASRFEVILSKMVSFCITTAFIILPYIVVTGIALATGDKFRMSSMSAGFLNILTTEAGKSLSSSQVWKLIGIIITLLVLYISQISICVPLAIVSKKPVVVVGVYYALTILFARVSGTMNLSKVLDKILSCVPYYGKYSLMTLSTDTGDILKAVLVSIIFIVIINMVSYLTFRKAEIK